MSVPYLDKDSSDKSLPMNQTAKPDGPVAWRSRIKGSKFWSVHTEDPTDAITKYATLGIGAYDIEPLFTR